MFNLSFWSIFLLLHVSLYASIFSEPVFDYVLISQIIFIFFIFLLFFIYRYFIVSKYNKKLREALDSFEKLVESAIEGIIIFNQEMRCIMVNQAIVDIFGYRKEELLGKHLNEFIAPCDLHLVEEGIKFSHVTPHEILSIKKDGTLFTSWTRGINAFWNGAPVRISSVIDITQYKNLQNNLEAQVEAQVREIEQKNQLIQQQNKLVSMGEMIGAIAHQWRQPLNALNINIQNLEDDYKEGLITQPFIDEFIDRNRKTIEFMSNTIDDFRNFFRIDKEKQNFSIRKTIEETLLLQGAQLKNNHISVFIQGEDFYIYSFKSEFQQVILNLINNAKDAILSRNINQGVITITLTSAGITIEDNGSGIDVSILDRVFEPYFTTKEQGQGTGLGLYIAKMIVEQNMNGTLHVSNGEKGAKFSIALLKS